MDGKVEVLSQANGTVNQKHIPHTHEQQCIVCATKSELGIRIWNQFICQRCEGEMVETDVSDAKYPFFIQQMKKIWLKDHA